MTSHNEDEHGDDDDFSEKEYVTTKEAVFNGGGKGDIITSSRPFGIEIEAYTKEGYERRTISDKVPEGVGITHDGSLSSSYPFGFEIQTPPGSEKKGEQLVTLICEILKENNAYTDSSCGLHVHLEALDMVNIEKPNTDRANDLYIVEHIKKLASTGIEIPKSLINVYDKLREKHATPRKQSTREKATVEMTMTPSGVPQFRVSEFEETISDNEKNAKFERLKRTLAFYVAFDDVMRSFLPVSRRRNRYCYSMKSSYSLNEIMRMENQSDMEKMWYREQNIIHVENRKSGHYDDSRYRGVNLHSLFVNGTIEIRYHSGTVNAKKMLYWVALNQAILDKAQRMDTSHYDRAIDELDMDAKMDSFFSLLGISKEAELYFRARFAKFGKASKAEETSLVEA